MAVEDLAFVPLCMTPLELGEWRSSNRALLLREQAARPCTDCPLGFAADMRAQGRCNGTPGGVAADPDEPEEEDIVEPVNIARPDPGIRIAVALRAPCPSCETKPKRQMSAEGRAAIAAGAQARRARERAEREAVA